MIGMETLFQSIYGSSYLGSSKVFIEVGTRSRFARVGKAPLLLAVCVGISVGSLSCVGLVYSRGREQFKAADPHGPISRL